MKLLSHYTILNTRPKDQAPSLSSCLESLGASVIALPTIIINESLNNACNDVLAESEIADYAIFVSANAVKFARTAWKGTQTKIIAIGSGTARALQDAGFAAVSTPEVFSSEGLLAMPALESVRDKRIIIFCGADSRQLLAETLRTRGAQVIECLCYKRECPPCLNAAQLSELARAKINLIISTSAESLTNLYQIVGTGGRAWLLNTRILVISTTMFELAHNLGFTQPVLVANNATPETIVKKLISSSTAR